MVNVSSALGLEVQSLPISPGMVKRIMDYLVLMDCI